MTKPKEQHIELYPIYLKLGSKSCLVVGGGLIGLEKAEALVTNGASVTVVSPEIVPGLQTLAQEQKVVLEQRCYQPGEAKNYYLVIAATNQPEVNQIIYDDCQRAGCLVNVVDVPELCDFYVPSILKRGRLKVAISTTGASPRLAGRLRRKLEAEIPEAYADLLEMLHALREDLKCLLPDQPQERMRINKLIADSDELEQFLKGDPEPLKERIDHALDPHRD